MLQVTASMYMKRTSKCVMYSIIHFTYTIIIIQGAAERTPRFGRGIASGGELVQCVVSARWRNSPYISSSPFTSQRNVFWTCHLLAWWYRVASAFARFQTRGVLSAAPCMYHIFSNLIRTSFWQFLKRKKVSLRF
jgi:hypothetical protein